MAKKLRVGPEWIGGILEMRGVVTSEGEPFRPEVLIWLGPDGAILGSRVGRPGQWAEFAAPSLLDTMERPAIGAPTRPERVRTASRRLAEVLIAAGLGIDVVTGPTPELAEAEASMHEFMGSSSNPYKLLREDVDQEAIAGLFRAAAALHRSAPWTLFSPGRGMVEVSISGLDIEGAQILVVGHEADKFGLAFFSSLEDLDAFYGALEESGGVTHEGMPTHVSLIFERAEELSDEARQYFLDQGWARTDSNRVPMLSAYDEDEGHVVPNAVEVTAMEAIALAMPMLLEDRAALEAAWSGGAPFERTISVPTWGDSLEVRLRVDWEGTELDKDAISALLEAEEEGDEVDPDTRQIFEAELLREFRTTPDAEEADLELLELILDAAGDHLGRSVASMSASELEEVVFDLIPRKVSVPPEAAGPILRSLRGLYEFLAQNYQLPQADDCLLALALDAEQVLERRLSDPRNFDPAKAFVMAGRAAGFDIEAQEGLAQWMQHAERHGVPGLSRPSPEPPAARGKKKAARKAARKARKKNRGK